MALPELALAQAHVDHALDRVIERTVAKAVALHADLHAVDLRIGLGERGKGKARYGEPVKISSGKHRGKFTTCAWRRRLGPRYLQTAGEDCRRGSAGSSRRPAPAHRA